MGGRCGKKFHLGIRAEFPQGSNHASAEAPLDDSPDVFVAVEIHPCKWPEIWVSLCPPHLFPGQADEGVNVGEKPLTEEFVGCHLHQGRAY